MSIAAYFASGPERWRLNAEDVTRGVTEVLSGQRAVGLPAAGAQAQPAPEEARPAYDAVLRAHCRLDREG